MQILTTREEKDAAYHLRHQVFAEELGWVPASENKKEIDDYDNNCELLGLFIGNRLIACLRILWPNQRFMIEKEFIVIIGGQEIIKTSNTIEVTRFCIARDVRKSLVSTKFGTYPIIMSLEKAFYNWCKINDMDIVYMVVSKHFFRLLNLLGMPCSSVAPAVKMPDGVIAVAAISSWTAFEDHNRIRNPALLAWFQDSLQVYVEDDQKNCCI
jgi:N-acyl amino acid synthase of PEP-CTERM/exosortase system